LGKAPGAKFMRLLFITSSRIGDAVLTTGLLDHLIADNPGIKVTIACGPAAVPLFRHVPGLEQLIRFEKRGRIGHWLSLWRMTIGRRWDVIVDLRGSAIGYFLRAGARYRFSPHSSVDHRVVQMAEALGIWPPPAPKLWIGSQDEARGRALVPPGPPILALGPTANWPGKQWPIERFLTLARRLTAEDGPLPGARVMVLGAGGAERMTAQALLDGLPKAQVIDLLGGVELPVAAAAMRQASLYIGNDSGLMHTAAALGLPTLGLFGPSLERHYAPYGPKGRAVRGKQSYEQIIQAPDYDRHRPVSYMTALDVDTVYDAAVKLLADVQALPPS
jgi:ADP-heptose:LPS heptosyltransferase